MQTQVDPLLEARLDMSLDDMIKREPGRGGYSRGRGRKFTSHAPSKPYDRSPSFGGAPAPTYKSSQAPPPVDLNIVTNRLYVNNLSYSTSWQTLKDHMRTAGNVVHVEIISDHLGRSKGCGIVEFETRQDAIRALKTLNDSELQGRLIYLREDREDREAPKRGGGAPHVREERAHPHFNRDGGAPAHGRDERPHFNRPAGIPRAGGPGSQVFVHNLPYETSWQDLKDRFRSCGNVIRADVLYAPDGKPKGTGVVLFETPSDARRAIEQMDEVDFNGRVIYVREDKYQDLS